MKKIILFILFVSVSFCYIHISFQGVSPQTYSSALYSMNVLPIQNTANNASLLKELVYASDLGNKPFVSQVILDKLLFSMNEVVTINLKLNEPLSRWQVLIISENVGSKYFDNTLTLTFSPSTQYFDGIPLLLSLTDQQRNVREYVLSLNIVIQNFVDQLALSSNTQRIPDEIHLGKIDANYLNFSIANLDLLNPNFPAIKRINVSSIFPTNNQYIDRLSLYLNNQLLANAIVSGNNYEFLLSQSHTISYNPEMFTLKLSILGTTPVSTDFGFIISSLETVMPQRSYDYSTTLNLAGNTLTAISNGKPIISDVSILPFINDISALDVSVDLEVDSNGLFSVVDKVYQLYDVVSGSIVLTSNVMFFNFKY